MGVCKHQLKTVFISMPRLSTHTLVPLLSPPPCYNFFLYFNIFTHDTNYPVSLSLSHTHTCSISKQGPYEVMFIQNDKKTKISSLLLLVLVLARV
jgi:hypothetical protein